MGSIGSKPGSWYELVRTPWLVLKGPGSVHGHRPASPSQRSPAVPAVLTPVVLVNRNFGDLYHDSLRVILLDLLVPGCSVWSVMLGQP